MAHALTRALHTREPHSHNHTGDNLLNCKSKDKEKQQQRGMRHDSCRYVFVGLRSSSVGHNIVLQLVQRLHIRILYAHTIYSWFCFIHLNCSFSCGDNVNAQNMQFFLQFYATYIFIFHVSFIAHCCVHRRLPRVTVSVCFTVLFFSTFFSFFFFSLSLYFLFCSRILCTQYVNVFSLFSVRSNRLRQQIHRFAKI